MHPALFSLLLLTTSVAPPIPVKAPTRPEEVFGLTNLWSMHLSISARDWEKMQPSKGGFAGPNKDAVPESADRKSRGAFGFDFEYVRGDLTIAGQTFKDVGVRFKGNSTYMMSARQAKRPFKIDLDRFHEGQSWAGLTKLTLNNNITDPTAARESLAYAVYRGAGVPAPRTAYVQLSLTVPGTYDRAFIGLYTLVETIDKPFLHSHFGSSKGLLLKPERVGPLEHLGDDWAAYEKVYRPKNAGSRSAQKRFMEFTHLVHKADDQQFRQQIGVYLDLDRFLRYLAATVVLSSLDSFVGLPHNYYVYHDARSNRFVIIPWDLDHSFGGLIMLGSAQELMDLSIRQPGIGRNRLLDRILGDAALYSSYTGYIQQILAEVFVPEKIKKELADIRAVIAPVRERERRTSGERKENWNPMVFMSAFNRSPDLETFATTRTASLRAQLEGRSKGTVLRARGPGAPGMGNPFVRPILQAADTDKDGKLSRSEMVLGVKSLFKACDTDGKGELDEKTLAAALERLLPKQQPGGLAPPGARPGSPAVPLARAIIKRAGKDSKVTINRLVAASEELFARADRDKSGKLDPRALTDALHELLPPPRGPFGPPAEAKVDPTDPTKKPK